MGGAFSLSLAWPSFVGVVPLVGGASCPSTYGRSLPPLDRASSLSGSCLSPSPPLSVFKQIRTGFGPSAAAAVKRHPGALVLLHPLVPHGFGPRDEGRWAGTDTAHAAGNDDVLQQVLVQEGDVPGLGHVRPPEPAAAAETHRGPDGENQDSSVFSSLGLQFRTTVRTRLCNF